MSRRRFANCRGTLARRRDLRPPGRRLRLEPLEPRRLLADGFPPAIGSIQNVILLIGDGMGFEHVNAARMFLGGEIVFDEAPYQAEMTTYAANVSVTDSGASGTAMSTGHKVNNGVIALALPGDGAELTTSLELYRDLGKATGLVTTTFMTHATPATFGAHAPSRSLYGEIGHDYFTQTRPDVLFGGALIVNEAQATAAGYTVVTDREQLLALDAETELPVAGQFGGYHLPYEFDGLGTLPHLSEMTTAALDLLDDDPEGFFLMVEGGRVDHAAHANDIARNVHETVELANTVETVLDWAAGRDDTLIIVTADHECGGMTIVADNGPGEIPDVTWSTVGHTGANVPVYAWGVNAELVEGTLDNTGIFTLTTQPGVRPLPPLDFVALSDLDPSAGDLWFRGNTPHPGQLIVESDVADDADDVTLTLYDAQLKEVTSATMPAGTGRVEWPVGGPRKTYYFQLAGSSTDVDLRLINMIERSQDGSLLTVHGTYQDDHFELLPGQTEVVVNGLTFEVGEATEVRLAGSGGFDTAELAGSPGNDFATLRPTYGTLTSPDLKIRLDAIAVATVNDSGGFDSAQLYDWWSSETFLATPTYASLYGVSFRNAVLGFDEVFAYSSGGSDVVKLFDSPGNDTFYATPTEAALYGESYYLRARDFPQVHSYADAGGRDVAKLFDSAGTDVFEADPTQGALYGTGFYNRAKGFDQVHAYGSGGFDLARLDDSPGDDLFAANPSQAALSGESFYNRAKHFDQVHAHATAGGEDRAELRDSPGRDRYVATPTYAALYGDGFDNQASHFARVEAYADAGGLDVAKLFDSPGDDDFVSTPTSGLLYGDAFRNYAHRFDQVHAYATAGGTDLAKMFDSPGDDVYDADSLQGAFYGADFYTRAKHFEQVHAYSEGGRDVARLYDTPGDDTLESDPTQSVLFGTGYYHRAKDFAEVYATADSGGFDSAYFDDSGLLDLLEAEDDWARMSNSVLDFLFATSAFDFVKATASNDGDTAQVGPLADGFELQLSGPWNGA